jgi:hypothetical protein
MIDDGPIVQQGCTQILKKPEPISELMASAMEQLSFIGVLRTTRPVV